MIEKIHLIKNNARTAKYTSIYNFPINAVFGASRKTDSMKM